MGSFVSIRSNCDVGDLASEEDIASTVCGSEGNAMLEEELDSSNELVAEGNDRSEAVCCRFSRRLKDADSESANALLEIALSAEFRK